MLIISTLKQLISKLNNTLEKKVIAMNERGLTSVDWAVYNNSTKRTRYSSVPTSDITAETVLADGVAVIACRFGHHALRHITRESPRRIGGGLDKRRSSFAPQGRAGIGVPASHPTQPVATRPLAIRKDGTWYAYGWDLTKNICEVFGQHGYLRTAYTYSPYGEVTADGDVTQPIQWSSEYNDTETALVYYNYRHYNPLDGKWVARDVVNKKDYIFCNNSPYYKIDITGLDSKTVGKIPSLDIRVDVETNGAKGQSSMHIHVGDDKYDYRNDKSLPGFYDRKTGKPLPRSVQKKLGKHKDWKKIMDKAEREVKNNGGLSTKFGGGKVIKGCVSVVSALEGVNMLNDYVNAMETGNIRQMDRVFNNFMANLPDYGTIVRSSIFMDADKFHREMKLFVSKNRK